MSCYGSERSKNNGEVCARERKQMTYAIVGRCDRTGELGVAVATYGYAIGGRAPAALGSKGAITSQANLDPRFRQRVLEMVPEKSPQEALDIISATDENWEWRQIGIVDAEGRVAAHTGKNTLGWTGHLIGDQHVALGNHIAGSHVNEAMSEAFEATERQPLAQRLLSALEAGRDAGGQTIDADKDPTHIPEKSAALIVHKLDPFPNPWIDLRVDVHPEAIAELRRAYVAALPAFDLVATRGLRPWDALPEGHHRGHRMPWHDEGVDPSEIRAIPFPREES